MPDHSPPQYFSFSPHVSIHFETHGAGPRSALLLHGFGASLETWRDIQSLLEPRFRLCLMDLKGFGSSSKPADTAYTIDDQASIVLALISHLQLSELVLIGHSYGAAVALAALRRLQHRSPATVNRLILIDAAAYPQRLPFFVSHLRIPAWRWIVLNLIPAQVRAQYTLTRIFYNRSVVTEERIGRYARFFNLPGSHKSFTAVARRIVPPDVDSLVSSLRNISVPTLILWGERDPVIPVENALRLRHDISGSRLFVIPNCGHVPQEEKPEETAREICTFVEHM